MRLVHATDMHWMLTPPWTSLFNKRMIGAVNLYLLGRRHHFDPKVQTAAVDAMQRVGADAALISGDLTATGLDGEFALARAAMDPILTSLPTLIQHGNHDVYTRGARRERRLERHFGPFLHGGPEGIARLDVGDLTILGLDPCRPDLLASGLIPQAQLDALPDTLASVGADRSIVVSMHYPLIDRHGGIYNGREHGLSNAGALIETLRGSSRRPDMIVHGHVHHGFRTTLQLGDDTIVVCNPGSGGYAWQPATRRAACFNVYTLTPGQMPTIERWRYDGEAFSPEEGGAYATGR